MISGIFTVRDMVSLIFLEPFCAPTIESAIRSFGEACRTDGHQFNKFPEDFALYKIGEWNGEVGEVISEPATKVAMAMDFARPVDTQLMEA